MENRIFKKFHDIRGSLAVVNGFVRCFEKDTVTSDDQELYEACKVSLQKIEKALDELQELTLNSHTTR